eukprot:gene4031-8025_t
MPMRFEIAGDISLEELKETFARYFPERIINLSTSDGTIDPNDLKKEILVQQEEIRKLRQVVNVKDEDLKDMEDSLQHSSEAVKKLHQQQRLLFEEFSVLRNKYDELKGSLVTTLWDKCVRHHPDLTQLPYAEDKSVIESDIRISNYAIGTMLGEGQFATVWNCIKDDDDTEYALKMILKNRVTSFDELRNISNEISILRALDNKHIIGFIDAIQTESKLYIITEKGGLDLFDFFDRNLNGVPELWAKDIIGNIVSAVTYCHLQGICHRDLKPENILITFDEKNGICKDLKLCDFGLGTRFSALEMLDEFCGSPGFFAPEMVLEGVYYGDKVDVWSVGCIILELTLGHDRFYNSWMGAYDYEILHDKVLFQKEITAAIANLPNVLKFSTDLNHLIFQFLNIDPDTRPSMLEVCQHPWLAGKIPPEIMNIAITKSNNNNNHNQPERRGSYKENNTTNNISNSNDNDKKKGKNSSNEISSRHRKRMEEFNSQRHASEADINSGNGNGPGSSGSTPSLRLPPLEPKTPKLDAVQLILAHGEQIANDTVKEANQRSGSISRPEDIQAKINSARNRYISFDAGDDAEAVHAALNATTPTKPSSISTSTKATIMGDDDDHREKPRKPTVSFISPANSFVSSKSSVLLPSPRENGDKTEKHVKILEPLKKSPRL